MPNWCSNRMYFSGEPAQIAEIKRLASVAGKDYRMMPGKPSLCISPQKEVTGVTYGVTRMYRGGGTVCVTT